MNTKKRHSTKHKPREFPTKTQRDKIIEKEGHQYRNRMDTATGGDENRGPAKHHKLSTQRGTKTSQRKIGRERASDFIL